MNITLPQTILGIFAYIAIGAMVLMINSAAKSDSIHNSDAMSATVWILGWPIMVVALVVTGVMAIIERIRS